MHDMSEMDGLAATAAATLKTKPKPWEPTMMRVPWCESPFFEELLEHSTLSAEQREQAKTFSRDGYLVVDLKLPDGLIDETIDALKGRFKEKAYAYDTRIQDADVEPVNRIACFEPILDMLRWLYRREPIPFQTLNFEKGTEQHTHSDAIHFHSLPERFLCGAWVALEDIDASNGPLFYYPGSHRLPFYDLHDLGIDVGVAGYRDYARFAQRLMDAHGLKREELHVPRGHGLIWAANLFHGGSTVLDKTRSRYSQVTHYFFEDCVYYSPMGSDVVGGKLQLRGVRDLRDHQPVPHMHHGKPYSDPTPPLFRSQSAFQRFLRRSGLRP
jgi:hypothetical protein